VGTWVGADDPRIRFRRTDLGQGSATALPITGAFFKQINNDPAYKNISQAKFPNPTSEMYKKLDCDLYELSDDLIFDIQQSIYKRDSTIAADTSVAPPPETFLQTLYKRKLKLAAAKQKRDSLANVIAEPMEGG
ncbi:MAG TPA: hypothetical protein PKL56_16180, partial [Cyclobacteriaceae bacterium]|nr:hypothetical protein [Cyclobacteriaceae bacterium]